MDAEFTSRKQQISIPRRFSATIFGSILLWTSGVYSNLKVSTTLFIGVTDFDIFRKIFKIFNFWGFVPVISLL